jgi:alpha-tubulin suppressor-like RCC1 family protein
MNLKRVRSLMVCILPLSLPLFAACAAPVDEGEGSVGVAAQALISGSVSPIAGGNWGSLRVKSDGTAWAWGYNSNGQLGDGTTTSQATPVQVSGLSGVTAVSAGEDSYSLALLSDGTVWAWGSNSNGQLGDGTTTNRSTPVPVSGLSGVTVTAVAAGWGYSLALASDGTVWAWGKNNEGQIGDGTTTNRATPVQVGGLSGITVTALASAYESSFALTSDGTAWAWGYNSNGQLGDGTTTNRATPVQVSGLSGVTALAAGDRHALALKWDGTLWAWGENNEGQLGDGTTTDRHTPVPSPLPCAAACAPGDVCQSGTCAPPELINSFSFAPENLTVCEVSTADHGIGSNGYPDGVFQAVVTGAIVNVAVSTTDATGTLCADHQQNDTITDANPILAGMAACDQYALGSESYVLGVSLDDGATLANAHGHGALTPLAYGTYTMKLYAQGPGGNDLDATYYGNGTSYWTLRVQFADGTVAVSPPVQAPLD